MRTVTCGARWWRVARLVLALWLATPGGVGAQAEARRPFSHEVHRNLTCTSCHSSGGEHGVPRDWTPGACASCHHDPSRGMTCDACHRREAYADPRPVPQALHLSVWQAPRTRELSFDHHLHVRLQCRDCHEGTGLLAPPDCASCHQNHHREGVECVQCHRPPDPGVHSLEAHASCGGAGCHSEVATRRPMLSRASCLICHAEKRDHKPGRECASCHLVPEGSTGSTVPGPRPGGARSSHPFPNL